MCFFAWSRVIKRQLRSLRKASSQPWNKNIKTQEQRSSEAVFTCISGIKRLIWVHEEDRIEDHSAASKPVCRLVVWFSLDIFRILCRPVRIGLDTTVESPGIVWQQPLAGGSAGCSCHCNHPGIASTAAARPKRNDGLDNHCV